MLPNNNLFNLEITTMCINNCVVPDDILYHINNFLQSIGANFVKPLDTRKKFKFKFICYDIPMDDCAVVPEDANIPTDDVPEDIDIEQQFCEIKIYIYSLESNSYAVEFQRRKGDSIAFNKIFDRAFKYLETYFASICMYHK